MLLENFLAGKRGFLTAGFQPSTLKIYWNSAGIWL